AFLTGDSKTKILKRSSLKEMWQPLQKVGEVDGVKSAMGLSFFTEEFGDMKVIGHTGTQKAFYSFFYIHPASHTAVIGITNTNSASGQPDLEQIRIDLSHKTFRELFGLYRK
ncbi:MAG TPA: hypothetical protein VFI78_04700, partial [Salinimicrobium sp.]|nr:hypothetical protein [Salinimicrobium sp.]